MIVFFVFGASGIGEQSFEDEESPARRRNGGGGGNRSARRSAVEVPPVEGARGERHQSNSRGKLAWND